MKLKLDLHTHCSEIIGFAPPSVDSVGRIVERIRACGLDGIAVTNHYNPNNPYYYGPLYAFRIREIVEQHFDNCVLIIPGAELVMTTSLDEIVELYFDGGLVFRFLAHPGYLYSGPFHGDVSRLQGIEIDNDLHDEQIDKPLVRAFAETHGLLLLHNSDAHELSRLGSFYNELDLDELLARAQPGSLPEWSGYNGLDPAELIARAQPESLPEWLG